MVDDLGVLACHDARSRSRRRVRRRECSLTPRRVAAEGDRHEPAPPNDINAQVGGRIAAARGAVDRRGGAGASLAPLFAHAVE